MSSNTSFPSGNGVNRPEIDIKISADAEKAPSNLPSLDKTHSYSVSKVEMRGPSRNITIPDRVLAAIGKVGIILGRIVLFPFREVSDRFRKWTNDLVSKWDKWEKVHDYSDLVKIGNTTRTKSDIVHEAMMHQLALTPLDHIHDREKQVYVDDDGKLKLKVPAKPGDLALQKLQIIIDLFSKDIITEAERQSEEPTKKSALPKPTLDELYQKGVDHYVRLYSNPEVESVEYNTLIQEAGKRDGYTTWVQSKKMSAAVDYIFTSKDGEQTKFDDFKQVMGKLGKSDEPYLLEDKFKYEGDTLETRKLPSQTNFFNELKQKQYSQLAKYEDETDALFELEKNILSLQNSREKIPTGVLIALSDDRHPVETFDDVRDRFRGLKDKYEKLENSKDDLSPEQYGNLALIKYQVASLGFDLQAISAKNIETLKKEEAPESEIDIERIQRAESDEELQSVVEDLVRQGRLPERLKKYDFFVIGSGHSEDKSKIEITRDYIIDQYNKKLLDREDMPFEPKIEKLSIPSETGSSRASSTASSDAEIKEEDSLSSDEISEKEISISTSTDDLEAIHDHLDEILKKLRTSKDLTAVDVEVIERLNHLLSTENAENVEKNFGGQLKEINGFLTAMEKRAQEIDLKVPYLSKEQLFNLEEYDDQNLNEVQLLYDSATKALKEKSLTKEQRNYLSRLQGTFEEILILRAEREKESKVRVRDAQGMMDLKHSAAAEVKLAATETPRKELDARNVNQLSDRLSEMRRKFDFEYNHARYEFDPNLQEADENLKKSYELFTQVRKARDDGNNDEANKINEERNQLSKRFDEISATLRSSLPAGNRDLLKIQNTIKDKWIPIIKKEIQEQAAALKKLSSQGTKFNKDEIEKWCWETRELARNFIGGESFSFTTERLGVRFSEAPMRETPKPVEITIPPPVPKAVVSTPSAEIKEAAAISVNQSSEERQKNYEAVQRRAAQEKIERAERIKEQIPAAREGYIKILEACLKEFDSGGRIPNTTDKEGPSLQQVKIDGDGLARLTGEKTEAMKRLDEHRDMSNISNWGNKDDPKFQAWIAAIRTEVAEQRKKLEG